MILGYCDEAAVSRHELFRSVPPLLMALGYEVIFQTSISELFPGLRQTIETGIEKSLADFEIELQKQRGSVHPSQVPAVARKLAWLAARQADPVARRTS
jgi:hypothetical protein